MKGIPVNRILSSAVRVAGSLAVVGGALAAGAAPAGAAPLANGAAPAGSPLSNNQAYGVAATGPITIAPVALATRGSTPAVSSGVVVPGFITTGGILDRAAYNAAYSHVGSVKVQLFQQVDQLNATDVMSSCRTILGGHFGFTTIQGGLIWTPVPAVPSAHSAAPQPRHQHEDHRRGASDDDSEDYGHAQQADGLGPRRQGHGDGDLHLRRRPDPVDRG